MLSSLKGDRWRVGASGGQLQPFGSRTFHVEASETNIALLCKSRALWLLFSTVGKINFKKDPQMETQCKDIAKSHPGLGIG